MALIRARRLSSNATASLGLPFAVSKRFGEHGGSHLAATVSYYSFFSVFPLLLVFVTILGIVLDDVRTCAKDLVDGALGQIPVHRLQAGRRPAAAHRAAAGSWSSAWPRRSGPGMGAVGALQLALDELWRHADAPPAERSS